MVTQNLAVPVIAIDGGAGVGKGTARMHVAKRLGFHGLDSGVLYRALGIVCKREDVLDSEAQCAYLARELGVAFDGEQVFLDGRNITNEVRSEEAGKLASIVAALPTVRKALVELQLSFRKAPGLVADGRDMCVIFDTLHRFFLTASPGERAKRRFKQLQERGVNCLFQEVLQGVIERDRADENRAASPLRRHPDAIEIDTTRLRPEDVCAKIVYIYLHHTTVHA
jgi:cytidylate kinase